MRRRQNELSLTGDLVIFYYSDDVLLDTITAHALGLQTEGWSQILTTCQTSRRAISPNYVFVILRRVHTLPCRKPR